MNPCNTPLLLHEPLLQPYAHKLRQRAENLQNAKQRLMPDGGTLSDFANGHLYYGFFAGEAGWTYREWAPAAKAVYLFGDFNNWQKEEHPLTPLGDGSWELHLAGADALRHKDKVRILVDTGGEKLERIPLYSKRVVQNPDTLSYDGQIWQPKKTHKWVFPDVPMPASPLVYECHVGMSAEGKGIASFKDFTENVLPRAHRLGYNTLQLMAVMEHPYYGSFGYQVSNFFAVSSRFGTPEDLKHLIDSAHGYGMAVVMDLVHSHAARNEVEGIGRFDGTTGQFFHSGRRGDHAAWGTKVFDYAKPGVVHFLLSNLKYWLEEYHFDGFRFDGVTSMLYKDHGLNRSFSSYSDYFDGNVDDDAVVYLQLASALCHEVKPGCALIAEDVSGMPGLCRPIAQNGIGFHWRLGMNMPDFWINALQKRDEDWSMGAIWQQLNNHPAGEKVLAYCECHDQAMVGDKTLMFRLADKAMYWDMDKATHNPIIHRAVALHKMLRFATLTGAGNGYLNFMGNEFGHPEWIDFPREGNGYSYHWAQRLWSLVDNPFLLYGDLNRFDEAMLRLATESRLLEEPPELLLLDEVAKLLAYKRGDIVCIFNFHPTAGAEAQLPGETRYELLLHTGWPDFGGPLAGETDPAKGTAPGCIPLSSRTAAAYRIHQPPENSGKIYS